MPENTIISKKKTRVVRTTSGGAQTSFTAAATSVLYIFYTHIIRRIDFRSLTGYRTRRRKSLVVLSFRVVHMKKAIVMTMIDKTIYIYNIITLYTANTCKQFTTDRRKHRDDKYKAKNYNIITLCTLY